MRTIGIAVFYLALSGGLFIVLVDWFGGCGEVFLTPSGYIPGECHGREAVADLYHVVLALFKS
jgi:hypothetical protein